VLEGGIVYKVGCQRLADKIDKNQIENFPPSAPQIPSPKMAGVRSPAEKRADAEELSELQRAKKEADVQWVLKLSLPALTLALRW
jgi:hypothetical protein